MNSYLNKKLFRLIKSTNYTYAINKNSKASDIKIKFISDATKEQFLTFENMNNTTVNFRYEFEFEYKLLY